MNYQPGESVIWFKRLNHTKNLRVPGVFLAYSKASKNYCTIQIVNEETNASKSKLVPVEAIERAK